jgi:predicted nucleotidyltransferase
MGAGDVKLMAGVGAWLGAVVTFYAFCASAVVGALMALAIVLYRGSFKKHYANFVMILFEWMRVRNPKELAQIAAERDVLAGIVHRLKTQWNACQVLLYGSAARGELDGSSDIDIMAILPIADWETKKQICDLCFEAELDIGIHPQVRASFLASPPMVAWTQNRSMTSWRDRGTTTKPRRGSSWTNPSLRRDCRASRTGVTLMPSSAAMRSSRRYSPDRTLPEIISSLI